MTCPHANQRNEDNGTDRVLVCQDCGEELARTQRDPRLED